MKQIILILLIVTAIAAQSFADGKMFWRENVPPKIPYQRALILFDDGTETLILQSRYENPELDDNNILGWVVPLPAIPEVASIPADEARYLFRDLSRYSRARITEVGPIIFAVIFLTVAGLSLLILSICLLSFIVPFPQRLKQNRGKLARYFMFGLFLSFFIAILNPNFISYRSKGVDVINENRVGIFDVSIVRSEASDELIDWLNKHKFNFGNKDTAAFKSYISRGWCFVVAIANPSIGEERQQIVSEGLVAPLILRFPHSNPIYPVALTGTGEFETEILIYLASSNKMTCDGRLTLRFAGEMNSSLLRLLFIETDPKDFLDIKDMQYPFLCKFRDRLTPSNMNEDIVFIKAEDTKPYREHIVKW